MCQRIAPRCSCPLLAGKTLDRAPRPSLNSPRLHQMPMKGIWSCTSTGTRRAKIGPPALCPSLLLSGRGGPLTALFPQGANSSEPHGGTPMQEHVLEVGQELVIEGGICLTLLAVEAGEV